MGSVRVGAGLLTPVLVAFVAPTLAGAATPTWSIQSSPNRPGPSLGDLNGVSCVSATDCIAVGAVSGDPSESSLIESWNGSTWTIVPSPGEASGVNVLSGVSCTSESACVAVGYYEGTQGEFQTLVESWDGASWSILPSPNQGTYDNELAAVSCSSVTACVAVGNYNVSSSTNVMNTLVESWNGSSWSILPSPNQGSGSNALSSVSCVSTDACTAVGAFYTNAADNPETLVESFDGTSWTVVPSPNVATGDDLLSGVSCTSTSMCMAVGESYGSGIETLAESWNGSSWSVVASPDEGADPSQLSAVSCSTSIACTAVGTYGTPITGQTLAESWDGKAWTVVVSPDPGAGVNSLTGLSCTEANACVAAGGYGASFGDQTLVESWDGTTWSVVASPDQTTDDDVLNSVSCTSLSFCIAVGFYDNAAGIQRTLIESWRGKSWNIVSSPDTGSGTNVLTGVSCTSSSACTAVGYDYSSNTGATLVESWNGTTWKVVSSPNQGSDTSILDGVSCTSASACTAVGYYWSNGVEQTLVESWNGVAWVVAPLTPDPGSSDNSLTGVSCTSATRCTAVGEYLSSSYDPQTLIEVWNGVVWNTASSPDPGSTANQLDGVSCTSSSACTAVGYLTNGSGSSATQQTLVESWNGSAWKVATSPDQDSAANILSGVSCRSTQVCTAVGVYADGSGPEQTLIESWNGTSWAIVPSFDQGSGSNSLSAVSCTSTSACMAAGSFVDSSSTLTLVGALR